MRKVIKVGTLQTIEASKLNGLIVCGRDGQKFWLQNLVLPPEAVVHGEGNDLVIRIRIPDGQYMVMGAEPGIAEKIDV